MLPSGFQQTLLAKFSELSQVLQPTNAAMDNVTTNIGFDQGTVATVLNIPVSVPVPNNQITNQVGMGYVAPTYNSYSVNTVPVALTNIISYPLFIPSIDQINSPIGIMEVLARPAQIAIENAANALITSNFTAANFSVNQPVPTTGSLITPQQMIQGGKVPLTMQNVQVEDPTRMVFLQHPNVYNTALYTPSWSQNYFVGEAIAVEARRLGVNRVAFGASVAYDQLMPASGAVGSQTYTSIYMTRNAMVAAYRPVPLGSQKTLEIAEYIIYKGLPLAIELSYLGKDLGWYYNVRIAMGVKVIRPEQGVIFSTTQQ